MKRHVYLIRHGESVYNVERKFCGWNETDLSSDGYKQVQKMAKLVKTLGITRIYSSPLKRARLTAEAISENIIFDDDLRELNFGELDGLTFDFVKEKFPDAAESIYDGKFDCSYPGGESRIDFFKRATGCFEKIINKNKSQDIIIVAHSCVIRSILSYALCKSYDLYLRLYIGNVGISKITIDDNGGSVKMIVNFINRELELN